jgi:hypothetical protein
VKALRLRLLPWLLCSALTVSCSATLWNRAADDIKAELATGNTTFLLTLKPHDLIKADLGALGDGALWNVGEIFSEAGRTEEAETLWIRALEERTVWGTQAGRDLFSLYSDRRDWAKAETVAKTLADRDKAPEFQRRLFEAYYFQKKDGQAWALLQSWKPGTFSADEERENQLFLGVLAARLGKTDTASQILTDLVWNQDASELHDRLEGFIDEDPTRATLLGDGGRDALAFQALVYRSVPTDTDTWLKGRTFPDGFWNHRALVEGLETLSKTEARADRGLRILDAALPTLTGEARFAGLFARGRLYRALSRWPEARSAFQTALASASTADDRRKTAWNWLKAWVQTDPGGALGPFVQILSGASDPAYYSDVVTDWISQLVQARRWDLLAAAWHDVGSKLAGDDRATLGFVLARLASYGLVDLARQGVTETTAALLEQAIANDPFSYEALVARAVLGRELVWPTAPAAPASPAPEWNDTRVLWESMATFGLGRRLANEATAYDGPLDAAFVDRTADLLQKNGFYRPSMQLLYRLLAQPGQVLTQDRAAKLFPTPFENLVASRAQAEGIETSLLYGLIRAESSFDTDARSWVGARGLTQLMPGTAAETAQKLRMKTYDLGSPEDNVVLGARYLADMIRTQGRIYLALMAYNAGGGRIKPWKESMGRLPEEIFVEAAPLQETRGYVKKILVSTVMTGVLHYGKTLDGMVRVIYPGFQP